MTPACMPVPLLVNPPPALLQARRARTRCIGANCCLLSASGLFVCFAGGQFWVPGPLAYETRPFAGMCLLATTKHQRQISFSVAACLTVRSQALTQSPSDFAVVYAGGGTQLVCWMFHQLDGLHCPYMRLLWRARCRAGSYFRFRLL